MTPKSINPTKQIIANLVNLHNSKNYDLLKKELVNKLKEYPKSDVLRNMSGIVETITGNLKNAEKLFEKAINLNPNNLDAHNNLAIVLYQLGYATKAISNLKKGHSINKNFIPIINSLGNINFEIGNISESLNFFKLGLTLNPDNYLMNYNYANVLNKDGQSDEAIKFYNKSINLNSDYINSYINIANAYIEKKKYLEASECYKQIITKDRNNIGAVISYNFCKMHLADWNDLYEVDYRNDNLINSKNVIIPFQALISKDDPKFQNDISKKWEEIKIKKFLQTKITTVPKNKKIKIAYFSSDYFDHATMYLISGLLRSHNKNNFEIYLMSYGRPKNSSILNQVKKYVNYFKDISKLSNDDIVKLSRKLQIDIAIDLKGYTFNSKCEIFASRLAPLQISFLGYPGSISKNFIDYLVADKVVIPEEQRNNYSEKIIFLPNSYQPNDNLRKVSNKKSHKKDFDLNQNSFVFCCFNNTFKITSKEFSIWLKVLKRIDNSLLWLMDTNDLAKKNLLNFTEEFGIDSQRIKFAKFLPQAKHLERLGHADLFLDTFYYNAHTTCSDALWAGVPVITKQGKQFSARVASSLLNSVDLNFLVAHNNDEYFKLIIDLSSDKSKLKKMKLNLIKNRSKLDLFNTQKYTLKFEKALKFVYEENKKGKKTKDIIID